MYLNEELGKRWAAVLDHADLPKISDPYKRGVTARLLENQKIAMDEERRMLTETLPSNFAGTGGYGTAATAAGPVAGYDPILISLIRRSAPNLMAYDVCGVQPMTGPTGLIFAMRSTYANSTTAAVTANTPEALFNEANTTWASNSGSHSDFAAANGNPGTANTTVLKTGYGATNVQGEDMGGSFTMNQMGFSIEKVTVTANTRGLQAGYTLELAQDLKAVHGLDAETELANILSTEILAEINREVVRTIYITANVGATTTNSAGTYNLATAAGDADGRWQVEKVKGLIFQLEKEANVILKNTRRGKGNIIICSTDVASLLAISGLLDYNSGIVGKTGLDLDTDNTTTFVGTLLNKFKVFVDPYSTVGADYAVVGYKGSVAYDAGLFYCPYVPLQMVRAIDPNTYQPKIGFKTRYGLVANPFAEGTGQGLGRILANSNLWYRKFIISNLK